MKLASYGSYGLHTIKYPSGRYGYVGTLPLLLCKEVQTKFGKEHNSMVFDTEQQAIDYFNAVRGQIEIEEKQG